MHRLRSKQFKLILSVLVSGLFLWLIYRKVDFVELKATMLGIRVLPAIVFFALIFIQLLLTSWRWNIFTRQLGQVPLRYMESLQQVVGSYSANLVVPGKWGEIVRIPWMKRYNLRIPVLLMVFLEKALDTLSVVTILFISLLVLFVTGFATPVPITPILLVTGLVLLVIIILLFSRHHITGWIRKKTGNPGSKAAEFLHKALIVAELPGGRFWFYYAFSLIIWILQVLQFYYIFLMLGLDAPLIYTYAGSCLALLAGVVPVSVAGMGTRDAVIIGFFHHLAPIELLASAGILSLLRIIIPSLLGIPFFINQTRNS